ncbi:MAG: sulfatase [Planctomycetes bacterium]|nr:sulfatase [Planctomycetota bacterium]
MRALIALGLLTLGGAANAADPPKKTNVLFILTDDMRPELGCYGHPQVKSPNIDALAKAGVRFDRAYCQYPLCNPSRASMLTGRLPTTTGVLDNTADVRKLHPDWVTLPEHFKANGYVSLRTGKIFHGGIDDPQSWSEGGEPQKKPDPNAPKPDPAQRQKASDQIVKLKGDGESHGDYKTADRAIKFLQQNKDKPFFLACGFVKPHSPPTAPEKYFDLYDVKTVKLPDNFAAKPTVPDGFPKPSLVPNYDLFINRDASEDEAKEMTRAYWASVSWVDWNVGRVVAELDKLGLRENTVIVFWGDHGYHLGEMGKWAKHGSLFEVGTRVPLIVVAPGAKANGQAALPPVQSIDLYPTLCELCGLKPPAGLQGHSLKPLLNDAKTKWEHPAFTVAGNAKNLGVAVRTDKYRYAEWNGGKNGAMLFDETTDPNERKNLADDPKFADVRKRLADLAKAATK